MVPITITPFYEPNTHSGFVQFSVFSRLLQQPIEHDSLHTVYSCPWFNVSRARIALNINFLFKRLTSSTIVSNCKLIQLLDSKHNNKYLLFTLLVDNVLGVYPFNTLIRARSCVLREPNFNSYVNERWYEGGGRGRSPSLGGVGTRSVQGVPLVSHKSHKHTDIHMRYMSLDCLLCCITTCRCIIASSLKHLWLQGRNRCQVRFTPTSTVYT